MKDKEKRNKKGSESTIGKIIYGFLLFMPLFAIGVTCGYAMFNKNAYRSYSESLYQQKEQINNPTDIIVNEVYEIVYTQTTSQNLNFYNFSSISFNPVDYGFSNRNYTSFFTLNDYIYLYYDNYTDNDHRELGNIWGSTLKSFSFNFNGFNANSSNLTTGNASIYQNILIKQPVDNVFYYAVDKVTESPLFSWAENNIIYTTTNATCNALSITTPFIPLLLSYWLIISIMYFLYDIALMLIWVLHDRIHALKDSIT